MKTNRQEFFKDKFVLLFNLFLMTVSFYFHATFIKETFIFLIPVSMFGFMGILELWFIMEKEREKRGIKNG